MKLHSKFTAAALLFLGLVLVNYLASNLPVRVDGTADDIYTLSDGTRSLLSKVEEPVHLQFYFSRSVEGLPINFKNYAARVQEMLRQYVRSSKGKVQLTVIDPRPDTPEEEKATASGLTPQMLPSGERVFFGLVCTQAEQQKVLSAFTLQRESFLEYDLSQLIYSVQQFDKKKLGLLSGLPLRAPPQMGMMMRQQRETQFVVLEWERSFDVVSVESSAAELPADLDALAVIHPQNLSPKLQYAIDQFILSGKPVFIAVDPSNQYFKQQSQQMGMMMGGPPPNVSSDLPELFKAYGITYSSQTVAGDQARALTVGRQQARYPHWLALEKSDLNSKAMPTAQLNSVWFIESGHLAVKAENGVTVTPLVQTSESGGEIQAMLTQFTPPEEMGRHVTPSGRKTIAAMIQGKLKSAFPNGAPKDEKPEEKKDDKPENKPAEAKAAEGKPGLTESSTTSTLIVVADTDFLLDDFSIRKINLFGQVAAEPYNDNLGFASNALEFLSGSQDLITIRGKGSSLRPFTVVRDMEVQAQQRYQEQLSALEGKLADVQRRLSELQGKKTEGNRLVASPEIQKAIEDFQKQEATMRGERRKIRKALREDIESLGNRLAIINLLVVPTMLGVFGVWYSKKRRK